MVVDIVYGMPSWILALVSICVVTAYPRSGRATVDELAAALARRRDPTSGSLRGSEPGGYRVPATPSVGAGAGERLVVTSRHLPAARRFERAPSSAS